MDTNTAVETVETVSPAETTATAPAKRSRGPKAPLTAGDIQQAFRLSRGKLEFVRDAMSEHTEEVKQAALKNLAKVNPELAADLGYAVVPKDEAVVDFRRGVFVHLAHLNAEKGQRVTLETIEDGVILRLVR